VLKPKLRGGLNMIVHTIVYLVLSVMTATAAFASSMPISKAPREQQAAEAETEATDSSEQ
jgi:hypothetical protein